MFNVGEHVRIKPNADKIDSDYMIFTNEMHEFLGNVYKVIAVEHRHSVVFYKLQDVRSEDGLINGDGYWLWDNNWLEPTQEMKEVQEAEFMSLFS